MVKNTDKKEMVRSEPKGIRDLGAERAQGRDNIPKDEQFPPTQAVVREEYTKQEVEENRLKVPMGTTVEHVSRDQLQQELRAKEIEQNQNKSEGKEEILDKKLPNKNVQVDRYHDGDKTIDIHKSTEPEPKKTEPKKEPVLDEIIIPLDSDDDYYTDDNLDPVVTENKEQKSKKKSSSKKRK